MDAPAVAVSRDGRKVAAAWMDERSGRNDRQVYWTQASAGAFRKESLLPDDPKGLKGHPSIAMDSGGDFHAAWEDMRSGVMRIRYRSTDGKDVALSPERGKASFPSLACGKVVGVTFEFG
ncbi:MAG TPA: hypothetical protein VFC86_05050, partial [Planctomycetota bacterium]|nr:hypothetical protein [Planctomycetota bacterium]